MNKKITAIILTLLMIFLVGCSSNPTNQTESTSTTQIPKEPTGFIEMDIPTEYSNNIYSLCTNDEYAVYMCNVYTDSNGEVTIPHEEGDDADLDCATFVIEYSLKNNKFEHKYKLTECPIKEIWGLELQGENIVVYSDSEKKCAIYDFDMNLIKEDKWEVSDPVETAKKSKFYTESLSSVNEGYCTMNGNNNMEYTFMLDDVDTLYINHTEFNHQIYAFNKDNNYFLSEWFNRDASKSNFAVEDYKNNKEINSASINAKDYGFDFCSTGNRTLGQEYAIVSIYLNKEDSGEYENKTFYWHYTNEPTNKDLNLTTTTDLQKKTDDIIEELKANYKIETHINDSYENISESTVISDPPSQLILFDDLNNILAFVKTLPDGMLEDLYSGNSDEIYNRTGIRLDLVNEVTIGSAFTQSFADPMEMCYAFNTCSTNNIAHEFMHLFDNRLNDYLTQNDIDLSTSWNEYNKGFEKENDPNEEYKQYEFDDTQFISDYAATNDGEDRAEMFSYIYTSVGEEKKPFENKGIKDKADYLTKIIREAFPSVQKVDKAYWEE